MITDLVGTVLNLSKQQENVQWPMSAQTLAADGELRSIRIIGGRVDRVPYDGERVLSESS